VAAERLVGGWWEGGGAYLAGLAAVEAYGSWVHERAWGRGRLPFLPLLLTSLYCALGLVYAFVRLYRTFILTTPTSPTSTRSSPAPLKRS
jgi:hypothetical protein